ncbi:MAG: WYL domain-containing protein, partial [Anaerolineaceae bacterium]|nr:WYL domain-containing protein [Anaerolineaceae bacterium]
VGIYSLVHRWGRWYIVGFCFLRNAMRLFRIDRILDLQVTDEKYSIPDDFDTQKFLEQETRYDPQISVRLRFIPEFVYLAHYAQFAYIEKNTLADGSLEVAFKAQDIYWAASSVLSFGPAVIVLGPQELKDIVAQWAQSIAELNQKNI